MVRTLNPLSKVAVCAVWLVAAILIFDARFQIGAILIVCLVLVALERTSPVLLLGLMVPFSLFGLGFLTTALLFREDSAFAQHVAGESVLGSPAASAGVTLFLRAVACGMISAFFALTTDPGAFVRGLMAHARLPPRFGYALFAALQLVPDLAAEAQQMRLARAMQSGRVLRRLPGPVEAGSLVIPLLAFAIRRAGRTAIAMEARGLDAHGPRTIMAVPPFEWRDAGFAAVAMIVLGGLIVICAKM